jgi:hypothetical protein
MEPRIDYRTCKNDKAKTSPKPLLNSRIEDGVDLHEVRFSDRHLRD